MESVALLLNVSLLKGTLVNGYFYELKNQNLGQYVLINKKYFFLLGNLIFDRARSITFIKTCIVKIKLTEGTTKSLRFFGLIL